MQRRMTILALLIARRREDWNRRDAESAEIKRLCEECANHQNKTVFWRFLGCETGMGVLTFLGRVLNVGFGKGMSGDERDEIAIYSDPFAHIYAKNTAQTITHGNIC